MQAAAPATGGLPQFALTEEAFRRIAERVTQNLLQTMPMLGQLGPVPAPVVAPVSAPRVRAPNYPGPPGTEDCPIFDPFFTPP